jgi:23S rRNA (cytosine1962-C5)-methyltransferase
VNESSSSASRPRRLALRLTGPACRALAEGPPWVFADGVARRSFEAPPGAVAVAFDAQERFVAVGLWDPDGPIVFRALSRTPVAVDAAFFAARIAEAAARRASLAKLHDGYRLVYGESDDLPGLVVDRYAAVAVLKLYTAAWLPHLDAIADAVQAAEPATRTLVLRFARNMAKRAGESGRRDGDVLRGTLADPAVVFREHGLRFRADVVRGQKTGFFLDQREHRARIGALAAGRAVLNVCSYSGGFSLYAARGGATAVASLDVAAPALAEAERNFALNLDDPGVRAARHELLCGDAFVLLPALAREGRRFEVVVLDPPAFAKRKEEVPGALVAYARLARAGLGVLAPGGILAAFSCSSRVGADEFATAVGEAASAARRPLRDVERSGHPEDHPSSPGMEYLKGIFARA